MTSVNDLNIVIKEFENSYTEIEKENNSLKYQLEQKDKEIKYLKNKLSAKDKIINKLQAEKEKIKDSLQKFKNFWYSIMNRFHSKIAFDKDEQYKYVSEDLHKAGVFSDDDFEITTNALREVKPKEEITEEKQKKENKNRWTIKKSKIMKIGVILMDFKEIIDYIKSMNEKDLKLAIFTDFYNNF